MRGGLSLFHHGWGLGSFGGFFTPHLMPGLGCLESQWNQLGPMTGTPICRLSMWSGLLTAWWLGSKREVPQKKHLESQCSKRTRTFDNLVSEVTCHHFCYSGFVDAISNLHRFKGSGDRELEIYIPICQWVESKDLWLFLKLLQLHFKTRQMLEPKSLRLQ